MVLQNDGCAPERHDAVADELIDGSVLVGDGPRDLLEIDRHLREQIIGR